MKKIPLSLRGILWSRKLENLNLGKDKAYIIHQVLAYGSLSQVKWLFKTFPKKEIIKIFTNLPRKNYSAAGFNFVKNYLLTLSHKKIKTDAYVKTLF